MREKRNLKGIRTRDLCTDESDSSAEKRRQVAELIRRAKAGNVYAARRIIEFTEGPAKTQEEMRGTE